jgi:hypothetical protein
VIEIINNGESLTKSYNRGLKQASNDVVVFCHDDIKVETKQWGKKLLKVFDNNEHGILGVAGSKYLSTTGKWWDDRKTMYGKVKHTHNGKSWLSEYSAGQGKNVEDVVNVDGVFFAVHKDRIKKDFDESVEGFHFYDVDFCFQNYLEDVKVGVITIIRINHMSIGETNDEWESNRKAFAEKYSDNLPQRIEEPFENRKMRVLIADINEGKSLEDTIELCSNLNDENCITSLVSNFTQKDILLGKQNKVKLFSLQEPPSYKRGDGKFHVNTPNGPVLSEVGKFYKIGVSEYDVIYSDNHEIINAYKNMYPESKFVDINSDEYLSMDKTPENFKELFVKTFNDG